MKKRKSVLVSLFLVFILSFITGCQSSTSGSMKEVNVISWSEYIPDEVIQEFEEKEGIRVNMTTYADPEEMLAKVTSSKKGTYDVIIAPSNYIESLNAQDLLEEIDLEKLSNEGNLDPKYMSEMTDLETKFSVPYMYSTAVIAINTDEIKDDITSYKDLLKSKYKDSLVIIEDPRVIVGIAMMANGRNMNDVTPEGLEEAKTYLEKLKPNIHAFNGDSQKTMLINGEVSMGIVYGAEALLAQRENPSITAIYPEEGVYFGFDGMLLTKNAENSENGYAFIDYLLDGETSAKISEVFPYINPNKKALEYLDEDYTGSPLTVIPKDVLERSQNLIDLKEDNEKISDLWTEFKN